jgi:hypothetical protein
MGKGVGNCGMIHGKEEIETERHRDAKTQRDRENETEKKERDGQAHTHTHTHTHKQSDTERQIERAQRPGRKGQRNTAFLCKSERERGREREGGMFEQY